jgi:hypothetical protein
MRKERKLKGESYMIVMVSAYSSETHGEFLVERVGTHVESAKGDAVVLEMVAFVEFVSGKVTVRNALFIPMNVVFDKKGVITDDGALWRGFPVASRPLAYTYRLPGESLISPKKELVEGSQ